MEIDLAKMSGEVIFLNEGENRLLLERIVRAGA
jgi:hypothetical protein